MSLQIWFWLFYVIGLFFGFWAEYVPGQPYPYPRGGRNLLIFVLVGLLGWKVFGGPVS
jgi:hypothetical protein